MKRCQQNLTHGAAEKKRKHYKRAKKQKSIKRLREIAWNLLSKIVRLSYATNRYATCYTCGRCSDLSEMQAGHAIGGRHNAVLLDESIIRVQCVRCNVFLRGNYPVFTVRLIREHGIDWWEKKLEESNKVKIYTRTDLENLIESYRKRLRGLEERKVA